jgi:hypothetical protein
VAEQLAVVLRRDGDDWTVNVAIGEPGREHARELNRQQHRITHETASLAIGLLAGNGGPELHDRVRAFVGPL